MNCDMAKSKLIDYLAGMLPEGEIQEMEKHLSECRDCQAEREACGETVSLLQRGLAGHKGQPFRLDPARRAKVLATVPRKRAVRTPWPVWWVKWQPVLNAAAAVLILATVGILMLPPGLLGDRREYSFARDVAPEVEESELKPVEQVKVKKMAYRAQESSLSQTVSAGEEVESIGGSSGKRNIRREGYATHEEAVTDDLAADRSGGVTDGKYLDSDTYGVVVDLPKPQAVAPDRNELDDRRVAPVDKLRVTSGEGETPPKSGTVTRDSLLAEAAGETRLEASEQAQGKMGASGSSMSRADAQYDVSYSLREAPAEKKSKAAAVGTPAPQPASPVIVAAKSEREAEKGFKTKIAESPLNRKGIQANRKAAEKESLDSEEYERLRRDEVAKDLSEPSDIRSLQVATGPKVPGKVDAPGQAGVSVPGVQRLEAASEPVKVVANKTLDVVKAREDADHDGWAGGEQVVPPPVFNSWVEAKQNAFSTFSIDVDTASFTRARKLLLSGSLPPAGGVRVEEFVNAFDYDYPSPGRRAFSVYTDRTRSPFRSQYELLRIGVRGKVIGRDRQRPSILTLVIDASGSMNTPDRLDLIKSSIHMLVGRMAPADSLSVVTFGSEPRLVLDSVKASDSKQILSVIDAIQATGTTQLEGGLKLGYATAVRNFRSGGVNQVILLSDGVANMGAATAEEILAQVSTTRKQGIYCSVFGFGKGPYNDAMLETLADKGDGVYRFVDSQAEARRVFVDDLAATLHIIARDVKIQVEFNPDRVRTYRQIGYENRALTKEQFRDDSVDAGEVGSGQSVTALYEITSQGRAQDPLGMVRVRWKNADSGQVEELEQPIRSSDFHESFDKAPVRFRLAAGVAEFADHLRGNPVVMGTEMREVSRVIRAVGLELNLDQRVADLVRMASAAENLMK